ncbi:MAG: DNA polymerase III subunit chi [Burkholderiaceae bacterium]|nr:DNA polymerase III subunit chi [Burkholderiaceae bacterium]
MTEVAFHFNAPDKLAYACRFARKVLRSGARLVIVGPDDTLEQLDSRLWTLLLHDFVAHCRQDASPELLQASPVILASDPQAVPHHDVLLNLGSAVPEGFAQYGKLVEVVSSHDAGDRAEARARWRLYTAQGYAIVRHDLVLKGE